MTQNSQDTSAATNCDLMRARSCRQPIREAGTDLITRIAERPQQPLALNPNRSNHLPVVRHGRDRLKANAELLTECAHDLRMSAPFWAAELIY